jgi:MoaA/NifB/PqqE/SkfB family radical SAM enzyme
MLRIALRSPGFLSFSIRTITNQNRAIRRRKELSAQGVEVPPLLIASLTHKCNLNCAGCYAVALDRPRTPEMTAEQFRQALSEARHLGISNVLFAGGEPFMRPDIVKTAENYPEMLFPVFTNGLMIKGEWIERLKKARNIVPVLSIEGFEPETDKRRGAGVYERVIGVAKRLRGINAMFGHSITATRTNFDTVVKDEFVAGLVREGAKVVFFVEYVPIKEGSENLILTEEQRTASSRPPCRGSGRSSRACLSSLPGEDDLFGGGLAAGRGFVQLSPDGSLEPCPFAPYSDSNAKETSLVEALKSGFLKTIRENHHKLTETSGGCALWTNRDWVKTILASE